MKVVEGIILSKRALKENDCISHILLRNGQQLSVIFYAGRGSKKKQTTLVEVGHMLRLHLHTHSRGIDKDVLPASKVSLIWAPEHIRTHYKAFLLLCFYLELAAQVSPMGHWENDQDVGLEGVFRALSNAIYYLDHSLGASAFDENTQKLLFLCKMIHHLGLAPDLQLCQLSGESLDQKTNYHFNKREGGFVSIYASEISHRDELIDAHWSRQLRSAFSQGFENSYGKYVQVKTPSDQVLQDMLDFLLIHISKSRESFRSLQGLNAPL